MNMKWQVGVIHFQQSSTQRANEQCCHKKKRELIVGITNSIQRKRLGV